MFSEKEDSFAALTIGAQQAAFVDANGAISSDITYFGYSKDSALLVSSMLDVAYMGFFLCACFMIKSAQSARVKKRRQGEITIGKYSVIVTGVPKNEAATPELAREVKEHFESITGEGSVHEVSITTQNGLLLSRLHHQAECVRLRRSAASRINRTRGAWGGYAYDYYAAKVAIDDDEITRLMSNKEPKPSVAFVTFNSVAAKEQLLLEYLNPLKFFLWQPAELRFRGTNRLWVKAAPEPGDLYWSHLPFPAVFRYARQLSTHLISIVWIMLTAIIITVSDVQSEKRPPIVDIETSAAAGTLARADPAASPAPALLASLLPNLPPSASRRAIKIEPSRHLFTPPRCSSAPGPSTSTRPSSARTARATSRAGSSSTTTSSTTRTSSPRSAATSSGTGCSSGTASPGRRTRSRPSRRTRRTSSRT